MEFEDMKVIWDSQNKEPLFAVNQAGLKSVLDQKAREFKRLIFWQEAQSYISCAVVVGMTCLALIGYFTGALERLKGIPMNQWHAAALGLGVVCWLQFGLRVYLGRSAQRHREGKHPKTLLEELERDIDQVQFEIAARKLSTLILGFIPPHVGGFLFTYVIFHVTGVPSWALVPFAGVMFAGFVIETRMQRALVRDKFVPRRQELEALKAKLLAQEN